MCIDEMRLYPSISVPPGKWSRIQRETDEAGVEIDQFVQT